MMAFPNVVRIILLVASITSFIPQYRRIRSRGDCAGIAPNYVLFNLIAATEQFALGLHIIVDNAELMDGIVGTPPTVGDWLNLSQFAVVWLGHLVLFGLYLYNPPPRSGTKAAMVAIYVSFLLISLVPVLFEAVLPPTGSDPNHDRRWVSAIWVNTHSILINPIVTALAFAALFPQLRELRSRPADPGALSVEGLAVQAAVFFVVALCWPWRLRLPWGVGLVTWYQLVGWAAVDNGVFAFVQAVLWAFARRRGFAGGDDGEGAPLIGA